MYNFDPKSPNSIWKRIDEVLLIQSECIFTKNDLGIKIDLNDTRIKAIAGTLMAAGYNVEFNYNRMIVSE